ncbi:hypothetical protein H5410_046490, partial [Solanum commersonii]
MQGSIVHSKFQVVTHHYQRISSSTKEIKCSHTNNDSIIKINAHTHKDKHNHDFTHRFALIFQLTFSSAHLRSKRSFPRLVMGLSVM